MIKQWQLCIMQSFHSGLFLTTDWRQQRSTAASLPGNGDARVSPQRPILHDCACDEDICIVHCQYDIMICCCALETQIWILSPIRMKMGVFCLKWQKRAKEIKGTAGVASLYFILSTVGPAQQGRMVGFISGGSLVANRGPVEWTCPVKRLLLAKTHLGFVKKGGGGIGKHPP